MFGGEKVKLYVASSTVVVVFCFGSINEKMGMDECITQQVFDPNTHKMW